MLNMNEVGAFDIALTKQGVTATFGVYLPEIDPQAGYEVLVRVIHKDDRFTPGISPQNFDLAPVAGSQNNLWQATALIQTQPGTSFGAPGTYLYRYQLLRKAPGTDTLKMVTRWFTDPFARATDVGELGAFKTPGVEEDFQWEDDAWKVPPLSDLVVYELHVEEFNSTFDGVIERLPYLKSLGVTCLELLPVTSLKLDFDWGYGPLHYFAPNERWGGGQGLKRLINACHKNQVAVILDVVYQHVDPMFPYYLLYHDTGLASPMIDMHSPGPYGPPLDFTQEFAREYVLAANFHWLHEYHVDGFRYDEATDYYDGPTGVKYAELAFATYNESLKLPRFTPSGRAVAGEYSRIIQCPEALSDPQEFLKDTYSNASWQDGLLHVAEQMISGSSVDTTFVPQLLLDDTLGFSETKTVIDSQNNPVSMPVMPFQYLESHDHSQLICFAKSLSADEVFGDRTLFYKLQPFAIALYTCAGIPMLWQGQEFAQYYSLPPEGDARIHFRRDINWEFFYDDNGVPLIRLYRALGTLRQNYPALRSRQSFYYSEQSRPDEGCIAYVRQAEQQQVIVLLNFSDEAQTLTLPFPEIGTYREMIDNDVRAQPFDLTVISATLPVTLDVPSHYGYIFVKL